MILHCYGSGGDPPLYKWKFYSGNSKNNNFLSAKTVSHFRQEEKNSLNVPFLLVVIDDSCNGLCYLFLTLK